MVDEGVPPEQLAAAGYGEFDPIASNETAEGRQQNRRLEIILMPKIISVEDS
jgi:chemotaxis protein MotB